MDLLLPYLLHISIFIASVFVIYLSYNLITKSKSNRPPGKEGCPIIGETINLALQTKRGTPEKFFTYRMAKYSPNVFRTSLLGDTVAVFCGASGNKFVFSNENLSHLQPRSTNYMSFSTGTLPGETVSSIYRKNIVPDASNLESLSRYIPIMHSMLKEHFQADWLPNKEAKVSPLVKKYTFHVASKLFMNITDSARVKRIQEPFVHFMNHCGSWPINLPGTGFSKAVKASRIMKEEIMDAISERKNELSNSENKNIDILSKILTSKDEDGRGLDDNIIASVLIGLLLASYETTSTAITITANFLAMYPNVYANVLEEQMEIVNSKASGELLSWNDIKKMKYTWCVVCESMRLFPPAQGSYRKANTEFTYAGFTIPEGMKIHWNVYTTHMNAEYFPEPEKFEPSRFEKNGPASYTFVPFGGGLKLCPGKDYARGIILVFLHNLVANFKFEKVNPKEDVVFHSTPNLRNGLHIRLYKHK